MAEIERPSPDVLIIHLSPYHSLDLVRIPTTQKYRIVFAQRWAVQQRAFVEVSYEQAHEIIKFFEAADDVAVIADPSIAPSTSTPAIDAALLPPPPPRTRTRGT
jgi:hypothetical protein